MIYFQMIPLSMNYHETRQSYLICAHEGKIAICQIDHELQLAEICSTISADYVDIIQGTFFGRHVVNLYTKILYRFIETKTFRGIQESVTYTIALLYPDNVHLHIQNKYLVFFLFIFV
jgi:hypothetical protein